MAASVCPNCNLWLVLMDICDDNQEVKHASNRGGGPSIMEQGREEGPSIMEQGGPPSWRGGGEEGPSLVEQGRGGGPSLVEQGRRCKCSTVI